MAPPPTLSAIMTVYNGAEFLQETLDGVFDQTFTDFELVVVNNGSTDGTQAILDDVDDSRLRVIQAPQHGSFGDGIRLAYENARGKFIAVQDSDDVSLPERFEKQVIVLETEPAVGGVSSAFEEIDENSTHLGYSDLPKGEQGLLDAFQTSNPLTHSTFMFRKSDTDEIGGYPVEYAYGPDFAVVIRLLKAGWQLKVLDDVLLRWRRHLGQASIAPGLSVTRAHDALYLYTEAYGLAGVSPAARRQGGRNIVKWKLQYGMALMGEGQLGRGLRQIFSGVLRRPLYSAAYLGYQLARKLGIVPPADVAA
jgi:glycosyltransferase involved in cell wall biosynthesis